MRRRAPFVKLPGDGNNRFGNTELTQAFEYARLTGASTSRRQIVTAAALAGSRTNECCNTTVAGSEGSSTVSGQTTTSNSGNIGSQNSTGNLRGVTTGLKLELGDVNTKIDQQSALNTDVVVLLTDLYTQSGYTPPIPLPTDPTNPS
jgi:hypothetical protein